MRLHNLRWLEKYRKTFEMGFQTALEYRVNFAISLISAAYPIFIQSFLWTAIYLNATEPVVYGYHLPPDDRLHLPGRAGGAHRAHRL